jgi:signal transduction histidine kinase
MSRNAKIIIAVCCWWTLGAVALTLDYVDMAAAAGTPVSWQQAISTSCARQMTWIPISLAIIWLVRRHPIEPGRRVVPALILVMACTLIAILKAFYIAATNPYFIWFDTLPPFGDLIAFCLRSHLMLFGLCAGAAHALVFLERAQEEKLRAAQLQSSLAQARLDTLSAQLKPHFLFNALNSIAELVYQDSHKADRMLVALATLLRQSLACDSRHKVTLREELDLLQHYLALEQIRLGTRLSLCWQVDPRCHAALIPPLLLQPLVENAIIHGIARRLQPGRVTITARPAGGCLHIEIEDQGGTAPPRPAGSGIGLANVRERLRCLYGDDFSLHRQQLDSGDTRVQVHLPLQFPSADGAAFSAYPPPLAGDAA